MSPSPSLGPGGPPGIYGRVLAFVFAVPCAVMCFAAGVFALWPLPDDHDRGPVQALPMLLLMALSGSAAAACLLKALDLSGPLVQRAFLALGLMPAVIVFGVLLNRQW
jgi:hypothetical protein